MKKIILAMFSIFMLTIVTIVFASQDISGTYTIGKKSGDYYGEITIKQLGNSEYDVEISCGGSRPDGFSLGATLSGKGKIFDGVLIVKNTVKDYDGKIRENVMRLYLKSQSQIAITEEQDFVRGMSAENEKYYYNEGPRGGPGFAGGVYLVFCHQPDAPGGGPCL